MSYPTINIGNKKIICMMVLQWRGANETCRQPRTVAAAERH